MRSATPKGLSDEVVALAELDLEPHLIKAAAGITNGTDASRGVSIRKARPSARAVADRVPTLCLMEAFESFVALALEAEGLVVSEAIKFPVRLQTRRKDHVEIQTHGYEVDLVGARANRLVLASVKSYLGSHGVVAEHVTGETTDEKARKRYSMLNDDDRPEGRSQDDIAGAGLIPNPATVEGPETRAVAHRVEESCLLG